VYGADASKVHVVPFGANIESAPNAAEVARMIDQRSTNVCKLLFVGAAWFRKGGDIAVDVARDLNAAGLPTELLVVGSQPRMAGRLPGFVRYHGAISPSSPTRLAQFSALLADAHFMLLPTRADCTPVVFNEANAFGVPCLTTRVGGITTVIKDGVNGWTFGPDAAVSSYCDYIWTQFNARERYRELARAAQNEYETRLNWSVAGRAVTKLIASRIA
jgi:glycosyltransferase involved in cell wall biosynthesis